MIVLEEAEVEKLEKLGSGMSGTVYSYEGKALKLFHAHWNKESVQKAYQICKRISESDVETAKTYDFAACGNRFGYLQDQIHGVAYPMYIGSDRTKRYQAGERMGIMLRKVHSLEPNEEIFPSLRQMLYNNVFSNLKSIMSEEDIRACLDYFDSMPGAKTVLHGDFHENNIMVEDECPLLIDLDGMCIGSPLFDLVQSYATYRTPLAPEVRDYLGLNDETLNEFLYRFLGNYFQISDRMILEKYDRILSRLSDMGRMLGVLLSNAQANPEYAKQYFKENKKRWDEMLKEFPGCFSIFTF